jgi:hypothetical protein
VIQTRVERVYIALPCVTHAAGLYASVREYIDDIVGSKYNVWILRFVLGNVGFVDVADDFSRCGAVPARIGRRRSGHPDTITFAFSWRETLGSGAMA